MALCLPSPNYFRYTLVLFAVVAFCSATHDIAADGLYIASLSKSSRRLTPAGRADFSMSLVFSRRGLVILAGYLESRTNVRHAWMTIFAAMGLILVALSLYHSQVLPKGGVERHSGTSARWPPPSGMSSSAFSKSRILSCFCVFIFLYRAGEGQVVRIGPLFLVDKRAVGGLGLTTDQFGAIYGTFGTIAFIVGSILGGYFTSWLGLKRALLPLICVMNFPDARLLLLEHSSSHNHAMITLAMSLEMFGYGFGFVGVILLMMQEIAPGKYQTAHYAFATALMNLGLMIPGTVSGKIQLALGYRRFFIWVLISATPAIILSRFIPIRSGAAIPATPSIEA